MGGVPYSQSTIRGDGYRADCSGYVAMALAIPPGQWGGPNTAGLVTSGCVHSIGVDELRPGDLIGRLGPGTEGDAGHAQVFVSWDNTLPGDNGHTVLEQTGPDGSPGPHERHYANWTLGYGAWRYVEIVDDPAPAPASRPFPLIYPPNYYGDVAGPNESHGGYYLNERPTVATIQRALIAAGAVPGISDPANGWADGVYEQPTTDAVRRFQSQHGCTVDGKVGPQTWAALSPYMR